MPNVIGINPLGRSSKYKTEQETNKTMKNLYKLAFILVIGSAFALAQAGAGQTTPSTPSTPSTLPQSGAQQTPESSQTGQAGSAADSAKAQSDIQSALRKQLPSAADNVTVSVTDDNKVQLSGTVSSDTEKQQVEQIAHSTAPNMEIVNKLNTNGSSGNPGAMPPSGSQPPSGSKPPVLRLVAYQATGSAQNPSGSAAGQDTPSTQSPSSQSPSAGAQGSQGMSGSSDVQDKIQKAIQGDSSLSGANINVTVADNKVELAGTVASRDQKKTAKQIAETNAGGMKVVDHLKVSGSEGSTSPSTPPKN